MSMVHIISILFSAEAESTLIYDHRNSSSQANGACSGLNGDHNKECLCVLRTVNVTWFGEKVFADLKNLKLRLSSVTQVGPKSK